jgi:hypothetical protein
MADPAVPAPALVIFTNVIFQGARRYVFCGPCGSVTYGRPRLLTPVLDFGRFSDFIKSVSLSLIVVRSCHFAMLDFRSTLQLEGSLPKTYKRDAIPLQAIRLRSNVQVALQPCPPHENSSQAGRQREFVSCTEGSVPSNFRNPKPRSCLACYSLSSGRKPGHEQSRVLQGLR